MNVRWQPKPLPKSGASCGHGLCVNRGRAGGPDRELVAFVPGFDWLRGAEDTVVFYDSERFPTAEPLHAEVRAAVESALRNHTLLGEIAPGFSVLANA